MKPASLPTLNHLFGTAAAAHPLDPRFLVGKNVQDLKLAFVPGVKGVMVNDALHGATPKDEAAFHTELEKALGKIATRKSHDVLGFGAWDWHYDDTLLPTPEPEHPNSVIRVLTNVRGRGTRLALGSLRAVKDRYAREEDIDTLVTRALKARHLHRIELQPGACLAFGTCATRHIAPSQAAQRSTSLLPHRAPAFGFFRRTLRDDYHRLSMDSEYCFRPR